MPKIEEDGKSWLRRPKLYKGDVEPYKKKRSGIPKCTIAWNNSTTIGGFFKK